MVSSFLPLVVWLVVVDECGGFIRLNVVFLFAWRFRPVRCLVFFTDVYVR